MYTVKATDINPRKAAVYKYRIPISLWFVDMNHLVKKLGLL
jgi:hypothetical protein